MENKTQDSNQVLVKEPRKSKNKIVILVLGILSIFIFIGVGAAGYWFVAEVLTNKSGKDEETLLAEENKSLEKVYKDIIDLGLENIVHITPNYKYVFYTEDIETDEGSGLKLWLYDTESEDTIEASTFSGYFSYPSGYTIRFGENAYSLDEKKIIISHSCYPKNTEEIFDLETKTVIFTTESEYFGMDQEMIYWITNDSILYIDGEPSKWKFIKKNLTDNSHEVYKELDYEHITSLIRRGNSIEVEYSDSRFQVNYSINVDKKMLVDIPLEADFNENTKFRKLLNTFSEVNFNRIIHVTPDNSHLFYKVGDEVSLRSDVSDDLWVYDLDKGVRREVLNFGYSTGVDGIGKESFGQYSQDGSKLIISHGCCLENIDEVFDLATNEIIFSASIYSNGRAQVIFWINDDMILYLTKGGTVNNKDIENYALIKRNLENSSLSIHDHELYYELDIEDIDSVKQEGNKIVINSTGEKDIIIEIPDN